MHRTAASRGFTLIELMVVISIISLLSTVLLRALNDARSTAYDSAAFSTGMGMAADIANCATAGGIVNSPNSSTNPTNDLCNLGPQYGKWRSLPPKWVWWIPVPGSEWAWVHLVYAEKPGFFNDRFPGMYCGIYPRWETVYSQCQPGGNPSLCRMSSTYSCVRWNTQTGQWEQR